MTSTWVTMIFTVWLCLLAVGPRATAPNRKLLWLEHCWFDLGWRGLLLPVAQNKKKTELSSEIIIWNEDDITHLDL